MFYVVDVVDRPCAGSYAGKILSAHALFSVALASYRALARQAQRRAGAPASLRILESSRLFDKAQYVPAGDVARTYTVKKTA
jgi:hypothetical protein